MRIARSRLWPPAFSYLKRIEAERERTEREREREREREKKKKMLFQNAEPVLDIVIV